MNNFRVFTELTLILHILATFCRSQTSTEILSTVTELAKRPQQFISPRTWLPTLTPFFTFFLLIYYRLLTSHFFYLKPGASANLISFPIMWHSPDQHCTFMQRWGIQQLVQLLSYNLLQTQYTRICFD